eukprot:CAMPEP_0201988474 /NCGR_PEP_ID=MMETSP0904-20121228/92348_1 /ASSEMBLY_ACC=CAM_ASM_000553 /TAXON_ID=420261 /ORGANISM="Thalassiosira antarctica, Strain CCMP982" /LENGTH=94 /DNA_ID=CAMNT_0048542647 /DNA_START=13 /DNA_END=297 /DNA_ORIENTATION=-
MAAHTFDTSFSDDDEEDCYYHYNHGTGRHVLNRRPGHLSDAKQPPKYSLKCICCNLVDWLIFAGCIAFLYFAVRFAFYLLNNYGDGDYSWGDDD